MQNVSVKYEIQRDENGVWCVTGFIPSTGQQIAKVYAKDTNALIEILLMLDGSGHFCPPAADCEVGLTA